jgi:hypothetical protein
LEDEPMKPQAFLITWLLALGPVFTAFPFVIR